MKGKVKVIVVKERFPTYQYLALGVLADEAGWGGQWVLSSPFLSGSRRKGR
jgi:hypothetical protein